MKRELQKNLGEMIKDEEAVKEVGLPSKYKTLSYCLVNVGSASQTVDESLQLD